MEVCGRYDSRQHIQSGRCHGDGHRASPAELETLPAGVCTELHSLSTLLLVRLLRHVLSRSTEFTRQPVCLSLTQVDD